MPSAAPNYFTCTLGEAAVRGCHDCSDTPSFSSILDVIDQQAQRCPNQPAIGFALLEQQRDGAESLPSGSVTFQELRDLSIIAAHTLATSIGRRVEGSTIGLLCGSSLNFVLTWLGLMRLSHPVMLLAPQLGPRAMEHLCQKVEARIVIYDDRKKSTAINIGDGLDVIPVPTYISKSRPANPGSDAAPLLENRVLTQPAFYFHTSGTSSGLPSPIPQHHDMVKALPRFQQHDQLTTFSTTPLYHGGLADCLRAWTSGAMIWCFPENEGPLTAQNIIRAVESARRTRCGTLAYFSSVPYVLQMLAEDERGLQVLCSMDLVGVGGAAMPVAIGNLLVQSGVHLLSRYGSAECGFLLSSHRDYTVDKEWEFLRVRVSTNLLHFEPRDDGLSELIVQPGWPFRSKANREDGSYATADLFQPHPQLQDAWRYHSRADSQITLANGKKFDPSPIEQELRSATALLADVYVFGTGKPCAGALLFPRPGASSNSVLAVVQATLSRINASSPSHSRIEDSMLIVVPTHGEGDPLPKSSKGSVLRHQADDKYRTIIESAYHAVSVSKDAVPVHIRDGDLLAAVLDCFHRVLHRSVDPEKDLYKQGVDSIACIQIRKLIEARNLVPPNRAIPLNIIYDQGTVTGLVAYLRSCRNEVPGREPPQENQLEHMSSLVSRYNLSQFQSRNTPNESRPHVVVLTGATGFLGAFLLGFLRQRPDVTKIYCLVRATSIGEARMRASQCQVDRGFPPLPQSEARIDMSDRIICLPFSTTVAELGLEAGQKQMISQDTTLILHAAWPVNFSLPLSSFEDQFSCLSDLLSLAVDSNAHLCLISSIAAASSTDAPCVVEAISTDPSNAVPLGYARSKWVAERICSEANQGMVRASRKPVASIIRIGQLCGDSKTGTWNCSEAYPLMFSASSEIRSLPDLPSEGTNWLPVDIAASSVLEILLSGQEDPSSNSTTHRDELSRTSSTSSTPVFHVANPHTSTTWRQVLEWVVESVQLSSTTQRLKVTSPVNWVAQLEKELDERHPAHALLSFWKQAFHGRDDAQDCTPVGEDHSTPNKDPRAGPTPPTVEVHRARQAAQSMAKVKPLDRETVLRLWGWIDDNVRPRSNYPVWMSAR